MPGPVMYPEGPGGGGPRQNKIVVAVAAAAITSGLVGGLAGVLIGANVVAPQRPAAVQATATPSAAEVDAANTDLCTRFYTAHAAQPTPQKTAADIIPYVDYVQAALDANPAASPEVRSAIEAAARMSRQQAEKFSGIEQRGLAKPSSTWTADKANDAEEAAWNACKLGG
ncbi:Uncharacterised protein [Mycobacteroides abscessus subsp. abscessus]|uniref:hypothetical protein n=1 Tax=Mycobacteroides abscessus TaxID=36809 RepID=UPI0009D35902|nr:hypothetical protein [Mycobacteroides abscessus]SLI19233.1 Uncharacterised protein [Mycobacteroides abscessus subsp. abscessus]